MRKAGGRAGRWADARWEVNIIIRLGPPLFSFPLLMQHERKDQYPRAFHDQGPIDMKETLTMPGNWMKGKP